MNGPRDPDFETLSAYLDGELDAARCAEVEAWLKARPEARAELDRMRALEGRIAGGAPGKPEGLDVDRLAGDVWAEIDRQRERASGRGLLGGRGLWARPMVWLSAAAAAAVFVMFQHPPRMPVEALQRAPRPAASRPLAAPGDASMRAEPAPEQRGTHSSVRRESAGAAQPPAADATTPRRASAKAAPPAEVGAALPRHFTALGDTVVVSATRMPHAAGIPSLVVHDVTAGVPANRAAEKPATPVAAATAGGAIATEEGAPSAGPKKEIQAQSMRLKRSAAAADSTAPALGERSAGLATPLTSPKWSRFMNEMSVWLASGDAPGKTSPLTAEQRDSVASTVDRWRQVVDADSAHAWSSTRHRVALLGWALTERFVRDRRPADCAAAREAFSRALPAQVREVEMFVNRCLARLRACEP